MTSDRTKELERAKKALEKAMACVTESDALMGLMANATIEVYRALNMSIKADRSYGETQLTAGGATRITGQTEAAHV